MNLIFILPQIGKGGGQVIQALELALMLKKNGKKIYILTDRAKTVSKDSLKYIKYLDIHKINRNPLNYFVLFRYLTIFLTTLKILKNQKKL